MKRLNFNIKDRKVLTLGLCLVLVCVFTLTVAYSALSAVLTINGNARVSAVNWDIYLNNPRVTSGSATTNPPEIKTSSTLEFETTLNMPGDFYEFVVDVVNAGDIDAMIENVVKTPDLTEDQAKFLKYEVSYQNGESITAKQLLAKDTTMPIKVRIEYRKDLSNTDLPTGQVVLDLALTLEYIQSDGTGSSVKDNGALPISANGSLDAIGTIVTIGDQQFYTIGTEDNNVKLLSMMNITLEDNPVQSETAGTTSFSSVNYWKSNYGNYPSDGSYEVDIWRYIYDESSLIYNYVNNYKLTLEKNGIYINEARLIKDRELDPLGCSFYTSQCSGNYTWTYSTSYWTGTSYREDNWAISTNGRYNSGVQYDNSTTYGVRPVIVISKDYFN